MGNTANYGLYIEDNASTKFKDWREKMNGVEDSNMTKIDEALANKADKPIVFTVSLSKSAWANSVQTVTGANFVADGFTYIVSADPSSFAAYAKAMIYADDVIENGKMVFHCTKAPTADISVTIVRVVTA